MASLIKYNVSNVAIVSSGSDYANGYIIFEGGTGFDANAIISVYSNGAIKTVDLISGGFGYTAGDNVVANVVHLISYNIASANIINSGNYYSNGYLKIVGGSGRDANASITTNNDTGIIESVIINSPGTGYTFNDLVVGTAKELLTTYVESLEIVSGGTGYSNGYIIFETSGEGRNANATISVDANGQIISTNLTSGGTGFRATDEIYANTEHLGGTESNITITLAPYNNNANIEFILQSGAGEANISATISESNINSAILLVRTQFTAIKANIELSLQKSSGGANLTSNVQLGGNQANISVLPQNEVVSVLTDGIYRVVSSNTDWLTIQQANTTNIFGTASVGILA